MTANGSGSSALSSGEPAPVIVLTVARSGSTLLRFILDSHPELACPPETCLGSACFMLARLWDLLEPSPRSAQEGFRPHRVPADLHEAAVTSIRGVVDDAYSHYLVRHGKRRWCDKSLDNVGIAELLATVYPEAQFVCLYRHCMDVIVSAVEACPWGLNGYGFDQYVAGNPGNSVAAVAFCWLDRTRPIVEFQEKYPDRCHGIRYEDLVTQPEQIAASLFEFLGVERAPGITAGCFAADHEIGLGDHKIWFTGSVSPDSLGQGNRVPVGMLPPEMIAEINQVLARLDYRQVDADWPAASGSTDPRAGIEPDAALDDMAVFDAEADAAIAALSERLTALTVGPTADIAAWWPASASKNLALLIVPASAGGTPQGWAISRDGLGLTVRPTVKPDQGGAVIATTAATWLAILTGQANMAAELRAGRLRLTSPARSQGADGPGNLPAEARLLARLLGLPAGPPSHVPSQGSAHPPDAAMAAP